MAEMASLLFDGMYLRRTSYSRVAVWFLGLRCVQFKNREDEMRVSLLALIPFNSWLADSSDI